MPKVIKILSRSERIVRNASPDRRSEDVEIGWLGSQKYNSLFSQRLTDGTAEFRRYLFVKNRILRVTLRRTLRKSVRKICDLEVS